MIVHKSLIKLNSITITTDFHKLTTPPGLFPKDI